MSGRQWHWIAVSTAAVAVLAAVLFNDTTGSSFRAHPFATVEGYTPEVGKPVLATPSLDATTVRQTTSPQAPASPVRPTPSPAPEPPPEPPPSSKPPAKPPKVTLTVTVPVYYPDCATAWLLGAAPIKHSEPGYRRELDRNHNGIACER
jgi:outer membrane biosynthesis protein TonB